MESERRILLIAAHPDDETIGAGITMARSDPRRMTIVHVTDGSPRDVRHAQAAGFDNREDYARARRQELYDSLALAGIAEGQCREMGFADQDARLHLPELVQKIAALVEEIAPEEVWTHPYEGGHPDHDSAAFAVAQVCDPCRVREFTSYHAGPLGLVTGEFLGAVADSTRTLDESDRELKSRMFACFRSQQPVLRNFGITHEQFRQAPAYDFTQPPHPGTLHYERLGWNITGEEWRALAREAIQLLKAKRTI